MNVRPLLFAKLLKLIRGQKEEEAPASKCKDDRVPEGLSFLDLVWGQEDSCEAETDDLLPGLGKKGSACFEQITIGRAVVAESPGTAV